MKRLLNYQLIRFAVVGLASNALIYGLYLLLTHWGFEPKRVMSVLYLLGVLQTFLANKQWTFDHQGHLRKTFLRFACLYACGYVINLLVLMFFVDHLHYPHQLVQGVTILGLAALSFLVQKFCIFTPGAEVA